MVWEIPFKFESLLHLVQKWAATRNYPFLYSTFFDLRNCYINSWDHSLLASSLAVPFSFRPTVGSQWSYPWYSPKVVSRGEWTFREWTFREFFRATQWVHLSHLTRGLDWREGVGWVRSVKVLVTKSFQNHDFFFWSIWKFYPRKLKIYRPWCLLQRFLWILWEKFFSQENMILIFFIWSHQFQIVPDDDDSTLAGHEGSRYNLRWPHLWQKVDWGMAEWKQYVTNHRHRYNPRPTVWLDAKIDFLQKICCHDAFDCMSHFEFYDLNILWLDLEIFGDKIWTKILKQLYFV